LLFFFRIASVVTKKGVLCMADITLKGEECHTSGILPQVGSKAPNFALTDKDLSNKHLSDFQGKVKFIYAVPSLDTETCLLSTKKFNERAKDFPDVVFITVSADLPFAHKRVCSAEGIQNVITLSMMKNRDFSRDYGTFITDGPLEGLSARAVIILDADNKVIYTELVPEISDEPDYEKAYACLKHG